MIDSLIQETQSRFIVGRQILDMVLVAYEIVGEIWRKKKEVVLFKVIFKKAYDLLD